MAEIPHPLCLPLCTTALPAALSVNSPDALPLSSPPPAAFTRSLPPSWCHLPAPLLPPRPPLPVSPCSRALRRRRAAQAAEGGGAARGAAETEVETPGNRRRARLFPAPSPGVQPPPSAAPAAAGSLFPRPLERPPGAAPRVAEGTGVRDLGVVRPRRSARGDQPASRAPCALLSPGQSLLLLGLRRLLRRLSRLRGQTQLTGCAVAGRALHCKSPPPPRTCCGRRGCQVCLCVCVRAHRGRPGAPTGAAGNCSRAETPARRCAPLAGRACGHCPRGPPLSRWGERSSARTDRHPRAPAAPLPSAGRAVPSARDCTQSPLPPYAALESRTNTSKRACSLQPDVCGE